MIEYRNLVEEEPFFVAQLSEIERSLALDDTEKAISLARTITGVTPREKAKNIATYQGVNAQQQGKLEEMLRYLQIWSEFVSVIPLDEKPKPPFEDKPENYHFFRRKQADARQGWDNLSGLTSIYAETNLYQENPKIRSQAYQFLERLNPIQLRILEDVNLSYNTLLLHSIGFKHPDFTLNQVLGSVIRLFKMDRKGN